MFCLSRQASPLAASPHARRSREISATGCGYPKPAGWFSSSRVAASTSPVLGCPVPVLSCLSSPGGLLIPPSCPMEIFWGGRRVPAGVAWPRDEATAPKTTCHGLQSSFHLPWPPELPAPPWPPLSVPLWRFWRAPTPPLPGGTVTAWDTPSGRGELCQGSVVCVMCSRLLCPYLVCFLSLSDVIIS